MVLIQGLFVTLANANTNPEVIFETSKGSFTIELYPAKAPLTVANFLDYVDEGFYDNTIIHRVVPDFVIQGGGFEPGMKPKETRKAVKNESSNRLKNIKGSVSMARRTAPDTATSQFFVNLKHNARLDYISDIQPGYTVFGRISKGMDVIEKISVVETAVAGGGSNVPREDIVILSARRMTAVDSAKDDKSAEEAPESKADATQQTEAAEQAGDTSGQEQVGYVAGEHYVVLDKPVATRDSSRIEVVEMFSYGGPHCYEFEPLVKVWGAGQGSEVDFWFFPAVWSKSMKLYAQAFYTAIELGVAERIHMPLFRAIVVDQRSIRNEDDMAAFFAEYGVTEAAFKEVFNLDKVREQVDKAEQRVRDYKPAGVPEIVVNGKYRIDRMRAGGYEGMLKVADYLVNKEREALKK